MDNETRMVYCDSYNRSHRIIDILESFKTLETSGVVVSTAGRVVAKRSMGKAVFFDIADFSGRIQCLGGMAQLGEEQFNLLVKVVKVGDIVGVSGKPFITRRGENTIALAGMKLLTTSLLPLPEKFHGLNDLNLRYRRRYLDLISNSEAREVFRKRALIISGIRHFLEERGFIEAETPIFQKNPCGASANPFRTHHDAKDIDLFLRISPETFLKQLVVGGMDKVYEIGKNFRNEGVDASHLQEFTMLEFYVAYWNFLDNMKFVQEMIQHVLRMTVGSLSLDYQGVGIDFSGDWKAVNYRDRVLEDSGIDVLAYREAEDLLAEIQARRIDLGEIPARISLGGLIDRLYKKVSRHKLVQPTFLVHHPASLIPLARPNGQNPQVVDSFQVLVNGWEIAKAYSELADPKLQRRLLEEQLAMRGAGDEEAMFLDADFITSLEYGMPPVSGVGLGIDRLTALITNQRNLADVVLFPLMK